MFATNNNNTTLGITFKYIHINSIYIYIYKTSGLIYIFE